MAFENLIPRQKYGEREYLEQLKQLLPLGLVWGFLARAGVEIWQNVIPPGNQYQDTTTGSAVVQGVVSRPGAIADTLFGRLLSCFAAELARVEQRVTGLRREEIPGLSVELLPEWENEAGLPDSCVATTATVEERQRSVHARILGEYATITVGYLVDYATTLGFSILVEETTISSEPRIMGVARMGRQRMGGFGAFSVVVITVLSGSGNLDQMKCIFSRIKPAHVVIVWQ